MKAATVLLAVEPRELLNDHDAETCADYARQLRQAQAEAEAENAEEIKFLHTEHKAAVAKQKEKVKPFEAALARVRLLLLNWCERNPPPQEVYLIEKWEAEITDPTVVPPEFCTPDAKLIEKFGNDSKGAIAIPGVKFTPKPTLTVRERKA